MLIRACRDSRRFAVMRVGFSGSGHWGERADGARDQENKGRAEPEGAAGGAERCESGKEREWEESCPQGPSGAGIEAGTAAIRWTMRAMIRLGTERCPQGDRDAAGRTASGHGLGVRGLRRGWSCPGHRHRDRVVRVRARNRTKLGTGTDRQRHPGIAC